MKKILCLSLVLMLLFTGTVTAEGQNILCSFYPVYILAQNVLENVPGITLSCLTTPSTGCLHDYQLLTGDMRLLSRADVLLINGAGMETFLHSMEGQLPSLQVVDASEGIALLCSEGEHQHDHEHEHDSYNAHIWLSPQNAMQMVQNMADGLSALLPAHTNLIAANAANYIARLQQVDARLNQSLSSLKNRQIVTFHDSFPYFAQAYGLEIVAVVSLEPEEPLSPRVLTEVVDTVRAAGNPPLFAEPQYKNAALDAISRETGAPVFLLDPMVTGEGALTAYEDVMEKNLQVLLTALQ